MQNCATAFIGFPSLCVCARVQQSLSMHVCSMYVCEGKGEREEEKHRGKSEATTGCLLYAPDWGPDLPRRHMPCPGTEPATSHFVDNAQPHQSGPKFLSAPNFISSSKSCGFYALFYTE